MPQKSDLNDVLAETQSKLSIPKDWPSWYSDLRSHADQQGVWHLIDLELGDQVSPINTMPTMYATLDQLLVRKEQERQQNIVVYDGLTPAAKERATEPSRLPVQYADVREEYQIGVQDFNQLVRMHAIEEGRYRAIQQWMNSTVDADLLRDMNVVPTVLSCSKSPSTFRDRCSTCVLLKRDCICEEWRMSLIQMHEETELIGEKELCTKA